MHLTTISAQQAHVNHSHDQLVDEISKSKNLPVRILGDCEESS